MCDSLADYIKDNDTHLTYLMFYFYSFFYDEADITFKRWLSLGRHSEYATGTIIHSVNDFSDIYKISNETNLSYIDFKVSVILNKSLHLYFGSV